MRVLWVRLLNLVTALLTSLDKGTQPFAVCDG